MNLPSNLVIIMVDGGFCSQLVKYALGEFLKRQLHVTVKYDITWFQTCGLDCDGKYKREFALKRVFPQIDFPIASPEEINTLKTTHYFTNPNPYRFCQELLAQHPPLYIDGYYEHITYLERVKDILLKQLDFSKLSLPASNQPFLAQIRQAPFSCAVHVRRGDFINLGLAFLTPHYYVNAIKQITKRAGKPVHFFFFSNDMDYIQKEILPLCPPGLIYTLVDVNSNDTGYFDLYLISQCQAQISSNSSFGFWGAFLNQHNGRCFVFPSKWIPSQDEIGFYASLAHRLPGSLILNEKGEEETSLLKMAFLSAKGEKWNWFLKKRFWKNFIKLYRDCCPERSKNA